jgi:hypothetical protein
MKNPASALALLFAVFGAAHAQDTASPADDDKASLELLEFLGEWRTRKGEFIDPIELQDPNEAAAVSAPNVEGKKHD